MSRIIVSTFLAVISIHLFAQIDSNNTFVKNDELTTSGGISKPRHGLLELMPDETFRTFGTDNKLGVGTIFEVKYDSNLNYQSISFPESNHSGAVFYKSFRWNSDFSFFVGYGDGDSLIQEFFNYIYDKSNKIAWEGPFSRAFDQNVQHSGDSVLYGSLVTQKKNGINWTRSIQFGFMRSHDYLIRSKSLYSIFSKDSTKTRLLYNASFYNKGEFYLFVEDSLLSEKLLVARMDTSFFVNRIDTIEFDGQHQWIKNVDGQILKCSYAPNSKEPFFKLRSYTKDFNLVWTIQGKYDSVNISGNSRVFPFEGEQSFPINTIFQSYSKNKSFSTLAKIDEVGSIDTVRVMKDDKMNFNVNPTYRIGDYLLGHLSMESFEPFNRLLIRFDNSGCFYSSQVVTNLKCSIVGIDLQLREEELIKVFPNPANEFVHISTNQDSRLHYSLLDIQGKTIQSGELTRSENLILLKVPDGMYFLQLQGEGVLETQKIIVSH
ncbi:MAG: T9SS type A sorting domain-containing protein [Flavobacteriales bacterium]|nr:T9SS type A sorting domain-containing protein [Flavobacteriales bacterium]